MKSSASETIINLAVPKAKFPAEPAAGGKNG